MASDDRIELVIEGLPEDDGRVRLSAFMSQLQSLSATLSLLDRESNEGRVGSVFQIAELSYKSPVRVVLEPTIVLPAVPRRRYCRAPQTPRGHFGEGRTPHWL
jgi:hypothetical protein